MKEKLKKITNVMRLIFGYGIMLTLFLGGLSAVGYAAAICIGGDAAAAICHFLYKGMFPVLIRITTGLVLFGLLIMYLSGETALTAGKKKKKENS